MNGNLPVDTNSGAIEVRQFFNNYFTEEIVFPSNQIDAVLGFFIKRGFDEQSARSTGIILLNQAKIDDVNIFELLDKLKTLTDIQLGAIVSQVLNLKRVQTSVLGYKTSTKDESFESRNILV